MGAGAGLGAGPTHEVKTWLRPDTGPDEDGDGEDEGAGDDKRGKKGKRAGAYARPLFSSP